MSFIELFIIAVGLSMDAFAISIGKGLCMTKVYRKNQIITGLYFGGFQAAMPIIGYFVARNFKDFVSSVDHYIAFGLLVFIGIQMLRESGNDESVEDTMAFKKMVTLAVATSIDALAMGVSFAFLDVNIWVAAGMIGITTFVLSAVAIRIGCAVGSKLRQWADIFGGIILIVMGFKILIQHVWF